MTKERTDGLPIKDGALKEDTRKLFSLESSQTQNILKTRRSSLYSGQESVLLKHLPKVEIFDSKAGNTNGSRSEEKLDSKKSVADLIASKRIKDRREGGTTSSSAKSTSGGDSDGSEKQNKDSQPSQKCKVKVLSDSAAEKELVSSKKPHFIVRRNGDIECLKDPESAPTEEISVVVEPASASKKDAAQTKEGSKPDAASDETADEASQKRNTDDLKRYLSERLSAKGRQAEIETVNRVEEVSVRVVDSPEATRSFAPDKTQATVRQSNDNASPRAQFSRNDAGDRSSIRSSLERPAQRTSDDGPKQFTYDVFMSWLYQEMKASGATSFEEFMKRLAEQGKLPKEVVEKFTDKKFLKEFEQFMQRWANNGGTPNDADMQKFFPTELRAAVLGVDSSEVDDSSWAITDGSNAAPTDFALRIAEDAKEVALRMRTKGKCFRGVKGSMRENGVHLEGRSAYMAKEQLERDDRFQKILTTDNLTSKDLLPGDVIVHPKGYLGPRRYKPHGHIAVYLGNGREASDHVTNLIGGKAYVFRPKNV